MSSMMVERPPTQPPPSRWGRLRSRVAGLPRRTLWLNIALAVLLVAAIVVAFLVIGNPSAPPVAVRTAAVTRGTVTASVTGSGNAASSLSTPVSFQGSGTVTAVNVKAGDSVTLGEVLATIDPRAAKSALQTAETQLDSARSALAQAASGPTAVKQQQDRLAITQAQQNLSASQTAASQAQRQQSIDNQASSTSVDTAQRKLRDDQRTTDLTVQNARNCTTTTTAPNSGGGTASSVPTTPPTSGAMPSAVIVSASYTTSSSSSSACQQQVESAQASQRTTLDADRAAVTSAQNDQKNTQLADRKAISTAQAGVVTDQNSVRSAQLAQQADANPETPDQIAGFQASLDGAQVGVNSAQLAVDQTTLTAPQAGTVLAVNGKVGESSGTASTSTTSTTSSTTTASSAASSASSAGSGFVVIANLSQLAVTANIAEADASKIQLGQPATITFPGTGTTATGSVTQITPQSTVTNNVVLYPITVSVDTAPPGVGVGATSSLAITTGTKDGVLTAPTAAITTLGDRHTVTVRRGDSDSVVPVEIGLAGDTTTEITSGVNEGDQLVLPSAAVATTTGGGAGFPRTGGGG